MTNFQYKVLFLAGWFPTESNPMGGIFIKKHAEAISSFCDLVFFTITPAPVGIVKRYTVEYNEGRFKTISVCYKRKKGKPRIFFRLINKIRYFKGMFLGLKTMTRQWGIPDIVHANIALASGLIVLILKWIRGIPYVVTEHWSGYTEQSGDFKSCSIFAKLLAKLVFKNAEAVSTASRSLLDSLKNHRLSLKSCFVISNVVNIPRAPAFRKKITERLNILTTSLLNDRAKNVSGLIEAFGEVVKKYPDARLDIIGDGVDRQPLTDLAANLGLLNKNVFFQGYVPNRELYKWFARANFFVLNSNYETFSVVTAEAIAHGVPVVVTKCGGPEEFVTKAVGILIERNYKQSLVEGIEYMIKNWRSYDPRKLYAYAKARFSPEIVGRQFYEIYKNILARIETDVEPSN